MAADRVVDGGNPAGAEGIGTLTEHVDCAIDIAVRIGNGTDTWTDAPTLLAHLRTIREDFCDG
jgi:hypothetical protein